MEVLHIIPSLSISWGGPPAMLRDLSNSLYKKKVNITIFSIKGSNEETIKGINTNIKIKLFNRGECSFISLLHEWN